MRKNFYIPSAQMFFLWFPMMATLCFFLFLVWDFVGENPVISLILVGVLMGVVWWPILSWLGRRNARAYNERLFAGLAELDRIKEAQRETDKKRQNRDDFEWKRQYDE